MVYHTVFCPPNHPANIAFRRRRWLDDHPNASKTPFDETLAKIKSGK